MTRRDARDGCGELEGFILCGGRSTRFGSDKAMALWRGRPLLAHAVAALRSLALPVRAVTGDPHPYTRWIHAFVMAERPDQGPLEGVRAALRAGGRAGALILSVDMPAVRPSDLKRLCGAAGAGPGADSGEAASLPPAVVFVHDRVHPFPGIYRREHLEILERLPGGSSMHAFLERVPLRRVEFPRSEGGRAGPGAASGWRLRNVNTPEDLRELDSPPGARRDPESI